MESEVGMTVNDEALDQLFREARTHHVWLDRPVTDDTLRRLYDLLRWGPTSANSSPARFVFLRTPEAKERLRPALAPGNVAQTMAAPVTAIVAYDLRFYEQLPRLFPAVPAMQSLFAKDAELAEATARRNSSLEGAYMILAARAVGLDCGPMSGFDNAKVDQEFFAGGHVHSNFLCNLGHGNAAKAHPRGPRLSFDEACTLL